MTTAIAALEAIEKDADDANDLLLAVAAMNAVAPLRENRSCRRTALAPHGRRDRGRVDYGDLGVPHGGDQRRRGHGLDDELATGAH